MTDAINRDFAPAYRRPIATYNHSTGILYFLQDDRLGTPQLATDSNQSTVWQAAYQPFGQASVSGTITQNLRFPGQYFDLESGWNHNGFRDYMPRLGRYIEPDPLGRLGSGNNLYAYVGNNPIDFVDPLGLRNYKHSEQETFNQLCEAYREATAGPIQGLINMFNNSTGKLNPSDGGFDAHDPGKYDFGLLTQYSGDTWTVMGYTMDPSHFGNFIAGWEGAAYDNAYLEGGWSPGSGAELAMEGGGLWYHAMGQTLAINDPLDFTGMPDILKGEIVENAWESLLQLAGIPKCGCK